MKYQTKKIALISEHASPLANLGGVDTGGQNVYVAQLAKHLATMGYLVDVFTRRDSAALAGMVNWVSGVRVIHINAGPQAAVVKEDLLQYMDEFKDNMVKFIRKHSINYTLVHANFFMSALVAMGIKKELGVPFAVTFHALGHVRRIHQAGADKFPVARLAIEEAAVRQASMIIAECPQDKQDLMEYYNAPEDKIAIVPCGFSASEFSPVDKEAARRVLGLPQDEHIILQLGRMVPRKGVDNVIAALAQINVKSKPVRLVIVGGECEDLEEDKCPEYARLMDIARKHGVAEKIIFAGRKDRNRLKFYYSASDIFITTPWYEPFGITPLEAMACGTPVIGSNVGGIKYSVKDGETGVLVNPHNPAQLADAVSDLLNAPDRLYEMGKQAIERVNRHFTWARVAQQINRVYKMMQPVAKITPNRSQAA
ncbi:glycosyltransferase family 4 protein [Mucilaginibacter phyllosphaerae]|uniref:Glycosyltransferase family 1 protein n=1 Tax=Mucilaginibacter phyllosphaerae TaxID=1812349 RepID=A0A4Y8AK64_9SPHI|nr:glycosyltransferase family 1 protein [Mucilaginibacter phyllosphaerae]MBB3968056.1 glycosyltransferase involved in cell wall biosynthesis [Mucilaginibacter phyllosphaerae]TEW68921.1 glycosyltransferase family 1 protein [Mucilaginibacter phyllosphaerae]GGH01513.1 transferase [Mucilaginibacter phyllosphaerae]